MKLFKDESGAVTVDWVVLAAALVLLAGGVVAIVESGLESAASNLEGEVQEQITDPSTTAI